MGSDEQADLRLVSGFAQQGCDVAARYRVEITGRFICDDEARRVHQRACEGHALLLAA